MKLKKKLGFLTKAHYIFISLDFLHLGQTFIIFQPKMIKPNVKIYDRLIVCEYIVWLLYIQVWNRNAKIRQFIKG